VPIGTQAVKFLKEYLEKIRPHYSKKNPKTRALFLTANGMPMTGGCVRQILRRYRIMAGIKKPVSPHAFRRSFATHMLQEGVDIRYIQEILGHRHLRTTQHYTKVMPVDLKKTHEKSHPNHEN
jgi:site-specific recombinase XerD